MSICSPVINTFLFIPNEPRYEKTNNLHMRKTKTQISFAVTAKLISAFVFATWIVCNPSTALIQNFQPLAIFSGCTAWFVSDLVRNHIVGFLMLRLKEFTQTIIKFGSEKKTKKVGKIHQHIMHQTFVSTAHPPIRKAGGKAGLRCRAITF